MIRGWKPGALVLAALVGVTMVMAWRHRPQHAALLVRPGIDPAECEVSECGPDGVPLSLYAG